MQTLVVIKYILFFFFKEKTAYEMRMSDGSPDVCYSDLQKATEPEKGPAPEPESAKPAKAESAAQTLAAASEATSSAAEPQLAEGAELVRTTVREALQIERASCRARACKYVSIHVIA